jgi:hypothetical protein
LIETLIGKGYKLAIYDEELPWRDSWVQTSTTSSRQYLTFHRMMVSSPKEAIEASDVVVVGKE